MLPLSLCLRSRGVVWMGRYRGRWRRSERRGTVGRSGTWWLWTKSWGRTIDTPYTETEGPPLRARCHQRTGTITASCSWFFYKQFHACIIFILHFFPPCYPPPHCLYQGTRCWSAPLPQLHEPCWPRPHLLWPAAQYPGCPDGCRARAPGRRWTRG